MRNREKMSKAVPARFEKIILLEAATNKLKKLLNEVRPENVHKFMERRTLISSIKRCSNNKNLVYPHC